MFALKLSKIYACTLLFCVLITSNIISNVICLISTPRSCSTAMLCFMESRGDYAVIHEPGTHAFIRFCSTLHQNNHTTINSPFWIRDELIAAKQAAIFDTIKREISDKKPSFVKEIAFAAKGYMCDDNFLYQNNPSFVFLIRNPHDCWISFSNKLKLVSPSNYSVDLYSAKSTSSVKLYEDVHLAMSDIDYTDLYNLFKTLEKKTGRTPLIIRSEELGNNPGATIQKFCSYTNIPFHNNQLAWQPKDRSSHFQEIWNCPSCTPTAIDFWYSKAIESTGFVAPTTYPVPNNINTLFVDIKNLAHRTYYKQLYENNLTAYQLMLAEYNKQQFPDKD